MKIYSQLAMLIVFVFSIFIPAFSFAAISCKAFQTAGYAKLGAVNKDMSRPIILHQINPIVVCINRTQGTLTRMFSINDLIDHFVNHSNDLKTEIIATIIKDKHPIHYSAELSFVSYDPNVDTLTYLIKYPSQKALSNFSSSASIKLSNVILLIDDVCASCGGGGF